MRDLFKTILCFCLTLAVLISSVGVIGTASYESDYPEGVTAEEADNAVGATDKLLKSIIPSLMGVTLKDMVKPMLYSSETLSGIVVSLYTELWASNEELSPIGIDISVSAVAQALAGYPQVSNALMSAGSWENVSLENVDWGVSTKNDFAKAIGDAFAPFNDIFYMLLCSGTYTISGFIKIEGADGYNNSIIPMLKALKCNQIISNDIFKADAQNDKSSMVKNIIMPVLTMLESGLDSPADTLTDVLPSFAYFIESGEMDKCMDSLIVPITQNKLVEIAVLLKLFDMESLDFDVKTMLGDMLTQSDGQMGIALSEIDFKGLSLCGTHNGSEFISQKGRAYVKIMRWLIDTLKLNKDTLPQLMAEAPAGTGAAVELPDNMLEGLLSKDTDAVVGTVIKLFVPSVIGEAKAMVYPGVTPVSVQYTPNLTKENLEKMLKETDSLLDDFVKEGGSYGSMESLLTSSIYNNGNITALLKGIYGALEKEGLIQLLAVLGIDATPKGVAACLGEDSYSNVRNILQREKWSDVPDNISWGFYNGSRKGFENALVAVLRPLNPLLRVVLAGENLVVMDSITVTGADGYNNSVIPLLEALGCDDRDIKAYDEYKKNSSGDAILKNITTPVFNLLDDVFEKPVDTLSRRLPNIVYFMNSGSLEIVLSNLLLPVTALTEKISPLVEGDMPDMSGLTEKLDINELLKSLTADSGLKIADFDAASLSGMGIKTTKTSKQVINGQRTTYSYIEANQTDVLMSLLRVLARTMKLPGNENMLMSTMGEGNGTFDTYASSLSEQFATMTEDELIEWLYNLLFKERAQVEIVVDEDYHPTIIYKEPQADNTVWYGVGGAALFAAIVGLVLFLNRKRLYY